MAPAAPPTQLFRPRAVTPFAVSWEGMQEQKPRQPCGRKSSFSPNALYAIATPLVGNEYIVKTIGMDAS